MLFTPNLSRWASSIGDFCRIFREGNSKNKTGGRNQPKYKDAISIVSWKKSLRQLSREFQEADNIILSPEATGRSCRH